MPSNRLDRISGTGCDFPGGGGTYSPASRKGGLTAFDGAAAFGGQIELPHPHDGTPGPRCGIVRT